MSNNVNSELHLAEEKESMFTELSPEETAAISGGLLAEIGTVVGGLAGGAAGGPLGAVVGGYGLGHLGLVADIYFGL